MRSPRTTPRRATLLSLAALATIATGLAGCGDNSNAQGAPDKVRVVAGLYPLQYAAERVGGDAVTVTSLAAPGAEPHDLELNPQQVADVADADLVLYIKGFQPALDEAVAAQAADKSLDALGGATDKDPHLWLDPTRLATFADQVAERLATADGAHAAGYRERAAALRQDLTTLDGEYQAGLKDCQRRDIVVSHEAYGYLAERYRLNQIGITGLTPEEDPGPQRMAEVAQLAKSRGVTTIFFETLVKPDVAQAVATEIGAKAEVLDPIEGLAEGAKGDYLTVMRENLTRLRTALTCR